MKNSGITSSNRPDVKEDDGLSTGNIVDGEVTEKVKPTSKKQRRILTAISIFAPILLIAGIVASVYLSWVNSSEALFASAMMSPFDGDYVEVVLEANMESEDETIAIDGSFKVKMLFGEKYGKVEFSEKGILSEDSNFTVSLIFVEDGYYVISDQIASILEEDDMMVFREPIETYNNKWIFISYEDEKRLSREGDDMLGLMTCFDGVMGSPEDTKSVAKKLYELLFEGDLIQVTYDESESSGDFASYDLTFSEYVMEYATFMKTLYSMPVADSAIGCVADNVSDLDRATIHEAIQSMLDGLEDGSISDDGYYYLAYDEAILPKTTLVVNRATRRAQSFKMNMAYDESSILVFDLSFEVNAKSDAGTDTPDSYFDIRDIIED